MPLISRVYVRTALVFLLAGLTMLLVATISGMPWAIILLPTYLHLFTVGFMTFTIAGVALWMFPRHTKEMPRGSEPLCWASYGFMTLGLVIRAVAEPMPALGWGSSSALLVFSAVLQWIGGLLIVVLLWPRVKEK